MILAITITVIIIDTIIITITNIAIIIPPVGISILSPWLAMMITVPRRLTWSLSSVTSFKNTWTQLRIEEKLNKALIDEENEDDLTNISKLYVRM